MFFIFLTLSLSLSLSLSDTYYIIMLLFFILVENIHLSGSCVSLWYR